MKDVIYLVWMPNKVSFKCLLGLKYEVSDFNSLQDMVKASFPICRWRHLDGDVAPPSVKTEIFYFLYALSNTCPKYQVSSFNSLQDMTKTIFICRWRHMGGEVAPPGVQTETFYSLCHKEYLSQISSL